MKRRYIKKIILCLAVFFLSAGIFAESKSFYSNASKETQALIKKADGLVAKGQYCSALSCFENIPDNEYTIYKKNEEYLANLPPSQSEMQKQARHDMAQVLAGVILAFIKVVGRALMLVVLVFMGFDKLASGVCKKKKRYR